MRDQLSANPGRGLMRRKELNELYSQLTDQKRPKINRTTHCFVKNGTGADLDGFSVVEISGTLRDPTAAQDLSLATTFALDGVAVSSDDETRVAIIQTPLQQNSIAQAVYAGVSVVRLVGPTGQQFATTKSGESTLTAATSGPFEILYDEGDAVGAVERYAVVRFGSGVGDSGNTNTTSSPCGCDFVSEGTVDCLGTADSPTTYVVVALEPLGTNIELTHDTSCEWISEDIDYDCSGS